MRGRQRVCTVYLERVTAESAIPRVYSEVWANKMLRRRRSVSFGGFGWYVDFFTGYCCAFVDVHNILVVCVCICVFE